MINGVAHTAKSKRSAAERTLPLPAPAWKLPEGLAEVACSAVALITEAETPPVFAIDRLAENEDIVLLTGAPKVSSKTMLAVSLAIARVTANAPTKTSSVGSSPSASSGM